MTFDQAARRVVDWAKAILDETVPADRLSSFLASSLVRAEDELAAGRLTLPPTAGDELAQAWALAARLRLAPRAETKHIPARSMASPPRETEAWFAALPDGKVVSRRGIAVGAGEVLCSILETPKSPSATTLDSALEALLRHVETRRRDGIRVSSASEGAEPWMEWLMVAVLFSRVCRQRADLRLLNAAFKLNDWAYPANRRLPLGPRLMRYLLSLAEAETAASERLA
jgi:hypothetical protein